MPTIKPISDLRNKAKGEISERAHPQLQLKFDLFSKLAVARNQIASGDKGRTLKQVMADIRKRLHEPS